MGQECQDTAEKMKDFSFKGTINGRGIVTPLLPNKCICQRPYRHILCCNCGHLMFGRVRYGCPKHKRVIFLIDLTHCCKCKCFEFMLQEIDVQIDDGKADEDDEDL